MAFTFPAQALHRSQVLPTGIRRSISKGGYSVRLGGTEETLFSTFAEAVAARNVYDEEVAACKPPEKEPGEGEPTAPGGQGSELWWHRGGGTCEWLLHDMCALPALGLGFGFGLELLTLALTLTPTLTLTRCALPAHWSGRFDAVVDKGGLCAGHLITLTLTLTLSRTLSPTLA